MKRMFFVIICLMTAALAAPAYAETVNYVSPYEHGLMLEYDDGLFEVVETYDENGEVRFVYTGETPAPVYVSIRCYGQRDQAEVDWEVAGAYGQDGHDAVIGNSYIDAMGYFFREDAGYAEQWRYVYIFSFMEDVFVIDQCVYDGIPQEMNDAVNHIVDTLELGGA